MNTAATGHLYLPALNIMIESDVARQIVEWAVIGEPAWPPQPLKVLILLHAMRQHGYQVFVETGTYFGDTTAVMAQRGHRVHTIELAPEIHRAAAARFAGNPRVECLQGDSTALLPGIVERLEEPALFWLDGHYSGGPTAKGALETPIMAELECLRRARQDKPAVIDRSAIFIDDMRAFGSGDYPTPAAVGEFIDDAFPMHTRTLENDILRILPRREPQAAP